MDTYPLRKAKHLLFGEVRLDARDEAVELCGRDTESAPAALASRSHSGSSTLSSPTSVSMTAWFVFLPVLAQYVLNLVPQNEPEIVDTVET